MNMGMNQIVVAILILVAIVLAGLFIFLIIKQLNEMNNIERLKLLNTIDVKSTKIILDDIVADGLASYLIYNVITDDVYMNEERQIDMVKFLITYTINHLSSSLEDLLKLVYKFNTFDELLTLVNEKVKLVVVDFSFKQNQLLDDESDSNGED